MRNFGNILKLRSYKAFKGVTLNGPQYGYNQRLDDLKINSDDPYF